MTHLMLHVKNLKICWNVKVLHHFSVLEHQDVRK